jgi:hypothetical protein
MAARLIVCFDADRLVRTPCAALYPEWGREFVLVSGRPSSGDWKRCATALAVASSAAKSVSVWQLGTRAEQAASGTVSPAPWSSAPAVVRRRLDDCGPPFWVEWRHADTPEPVPVSMHAVIVRTAFERPSPAEEHELGQTWLLPIGLRFLIDRHLLMQGLHAPTAEVSQVAVVSTVGGLRSAITSWSSNLAGSKQQLVQERNRQLAAPCDAKLNDTDVGGLLEMRYTPADVSSLELSLLQHLQEDDREIGQWFTAEANALHDAFAQFQSALAVDFRNAVRTLSNAEPTVDASHWAQAEQASTTEGALSMSCDSVRGVVVQRMAALHGRPPAQETPKALEAAISEWLTNHRAEVLRRARRRPTAPIALVGCGTSIALGAMAWAWGLVQPAGSPMPWALLGEAAIGGAAFLVALTAAGVVWRWRVARRSMNAAKEALNESVRTQFEAAAIAALDAAQAALQTMLLGRNLELVDRACDAQRTLLAQQEHHLDALNEHLALAGEIAVEPLPATPPVPEPVEPTRRPEDQRAYWWRGGEGLELTKLHMGPAEIEPDTSPENLAALRRLAGAKFIEIEQ